MTPEERIIEQLENLRMVSLGNLSSYSQVSLDELIPLVKELSARGVLRFGGGGCGSSCGTCSSTCDDNSSQELFTEATIVISTLLGKNREDEEE